MAPYSKDDGGKRCLGDLCGGSDTGVHTISSCWYYFSSDFCFLLFILSILRSTFILAILVPAIITTTFFIIPTIVTVFGSGILFATRVPHIEVVTLALPYRVQDVELSMQALGSRFRRYH